MSSVLFLRFRNLKICLNGSKTIKWLIFLISKSIVLNILIYLLPTLFLSSFKNFIRVIYECNSFLLEIRSLQIKLILTFSDLISFLNLALLRVKVGCPKSLAGIKISSTCNLCIQVDDQRYALYYDPTDVNPSHILKTC